MCMFIRTHSSSEVIPVIHVRTEELSPRGEISASVSIEKICGNPLVDGQ